MQIYHIVKVTYLPASRAHGARLRITSEKYEQSLLISRYEHMFENTDSVAEMGAIYLRSLGFNIIGVGKGYAAKSMYVISDTFKPLK